MTTEELCFAFLSVFPQLTEEIKDHPSNVLLTEACLQEFMHCNAPVDSVREKMIDFLSMYSEEQLARLTVPTVLNDILQKTRKRDIGDIFLIPNTPRFRFYGAFGKEWDFCFQATPRVYTTPGWHVAVETWITNHKNNNWSCHGYGIDAFLPLNLFNGKKEGKYILFQHEGREVKLRLCQKDYRYRGEDFEQVCVEQLHRYRPYMRKDLLDVETETKIFNAEFQDYLNSFEPN